MERKPVLLNKNTVAFIQIFEKYDDIDDIMFGCWDYDKGHNPAKISKEAAKEFIRQLKEHWCVNFLKALIEECENTITEHNKSLETDQRSRAI